MRIIQLLPTLAYGDAVSNDTIALKQAICELGYKTAIYAENIDPRLPKGVAYSINKIPVMDSNDIIIYHLSTGTDLNYKIVEYKCKKIIIYHNITPPEYFRGYSNEAFLLSTEGLKATKYLADKVDYCLSDSFYNKKILLDMNYKCSIDVLPILIPFEDYRKTPNKKIIEAYNNSAINIIFTGRIAPNKKHEDIVNSFYYYKNYVNPNSRLFLIGSYLGTEKYYQKLKSYVAALRLSDVIFTGHIDFDEIIAYYKIADVFLCMSEHEGFCVPLVEAMYHNVPIIAYDSSAIADTLGGSGILLQGKNPMMISEMINKLINDTNLRKTVVMNQKKRLNDFSYENIKSKFINYINKFIEEKDE